MNKNTKTVFRIKTKLNIKVETDEMKCVTPNMVKKLQPRGPQNIQHTNLLCEKRDPEEVQY